MTDFLQYTPIILHSSELSISPALLMLAFLLDLVIGDPRRLPHPVRIMGSAISKLEILLRRFFKTPSHEKVGGILLVIVIITSAFGITFLYAKQFHIYSFTHSPIHPFT